MWTQPSWPWLGRETQKGASFSLSANFGMPLSELTCFVFVIITDSKQQTDMQAKTVEPVLFRFLHAHIEKGHNLYWLAWIQQRNLQCVSSPGITSWGLTSPCRCAQTQNSKSFSSY